MMEGGRVVEESKAAEVVKTGRQGMLRVAGDGFG
jgi:hypothetical protein